MKFTLSWLKRYLKTNVDIEKISHALTSIGLEVEQIIEPNKNLKLFKVAKILKAEKHPNADKLKLCDVDTGTEILKVVCGASNAKEGLITVYAPPGAIIPKNNMKLTVAKIRGVESRGMLCSGSELNITDESDGIIELKNKKIGSSFFESGNEHTIDISITPNRSDCLGVVGIARDLSASGIGKFIEPKKINFKASSKKKINVKIEKNSGCKSFGSIYIEDVKNCESPNWLKEYLVSVGLRPISAIVDITNFVMFDLNRPMHAYDADRIDKEIIVRQSKGNEKFEALDDKEYLIPEGACLITDHSKILGLGGVIGGKSCSINLETKNILLEAASFEPERISKVSKQLSLITDAKYRFERGVDPKSIGYGLKLATKLISEICGGKPSSINISGKILNKINQIKFNNDDFKKLIGANVSTKESEKILNNLGFNVKTKKNIFDLQIPSWRPDINQAADIIEEILRIKGLDIIPSISPDTKKYKDTLTYNQKLYRLTQRAIASRGYYELVTWSFTDSKINKMFSSSEIKITNPISSDLDCLRTSNFINLLIQAKKNIDRSLSNFSLFEIGPIFFENLSQKSVAAGVSLGNKVHASWLDKNKPFTVFDTKENLFYILSDIGLSLDNIVIKNSSKKYYHPGKSGDVFLNNHDNILIASFGVIHPEITKHLDLDTSSVIGFEIYLDHITESLSLKRRLKKNFEKSNFQVVERDFAFLFNRNILSKQIVDAIHKTSLSVIKSIDIFDVFEGDVIGKDKKSIAFKVIFEPKEKTFTDQEIDNLSNQIIKSVQNIGGELRS